MAISGDYIKQMGLRVWTCRGAEDQPPPSGAEQKNPQRSLFVGVPMAARLGLVRRTLVGVVKQSSFTDSQSRKCDESATVAHAACVNIAVQDFCRLSTGVVYQSLTRLGDERQDDGMDCHGSNSVVASSRCVSSLQSSK